MNAKLAAILLLALFVPAMAEEARKPPPEKPAEAAEADVPEKQPVCDVIDCRPFDGSDYSMRIQLLPQVLKFPLPPDEWIEFPLFLSDEKAAGVHRARGREVIGVTYYEERMGRLAAAELKLGFKELSQPGKPVTLADAQSLAAADRAQRILNEAIAEHDSAVQRRLREGVAWNDRVRKPLVEARVNLRLGRVDQHLRQGKLDAAEAECQRVAADLPAGDSAWTELDARQDRILKARADAVWSKQDYAGARALLERIATSPGRGPSPAAKKLQEQLIARASELLREAQSIKASSPQKAVDRIHEAAAVWPSLAGLEETRREIVEGYPILRCAYPELPADLCPLTVQSAVDRHAISLVSESLVRWADDPATGGRFEPQLAAARPFSLVRGRGFRLPSVKWSDSTDADARLCTVEDVRFTVKLMQTPGVPGYVPTGALHVQGVENAEENDPLTALIRLARDDWQPLAQMDFKILPRHCFAAADTPAELLRRLQQFSREPVGTGPYRAVRESGESSGVRRFVSNPHYREPGLPKIREIVFERHDSANAVELLLQKRIHLVYDVRPDQLGQIEGKGPKVAALKTPTVWFLAPNYRRKQPQNANLRLAVACAIDREAILNQYFRSPGRNGDHAALSGPYPAGSWAEKKPDAAVFATARAKTLASLAAKELGEPLALRLTYPSGNAEIESACKLIESQVKDAGIALELKPISAATYREELARSGDFDLAYWSYTFPDGTLAIEPLLGLASDRETVGPMHLRPDEELASLLRDLQLHKSFREIRKLSQRVHEHVARQAVIVPLWQLDVYVAVAPSVKDYVLDPRELFGNVAHWRLETGR